VVFGTRDILYGTVRSDARLATKLSMYVIWVPRYWSVVDDDLDECYRN